jgi:hypothetical protein
MVRRVLGAVVMSVAVIALVGSATVAVEPSLPAASGNGCHGIVNAYAHAADAALPALQAVAEKLGCDLSGVERVAKPAGKPDNSAADEDDDQSEPSEDANETDEDANETDEDANETDEDAGAAGPDVQGKCDLIATRLAAAQARPHGKSADAFARQATHWGCDSN